MTKKFLITALILVSGLVQAGIVPITKNVVAVESATEYPLTVLSGETRDFQFEFRQNNVLMNVSNTTVETYLYQEGTTNPVYYILGTSSASGIVDTIWASTNGTAAGRYRYVTTARTNQDVLASARGYIVVKPGISGGSTNAAPVWQYRPETDPIYSAVSNNIVASNSLLLGGYTAQELANAQMTYFIWGSLTSTEFTNFPAKVAKIESPVAQPVWTSTVSNVSNNMNIGFASIKTNQISRLLMPGLVNVHLPILRSGNAQARMMRANLRVYENDQTTLVAEYHGSDTLIPNVLDHAEFDISVTNELNITDNGRFIIVYFTTVSGWTGNETISVYSQDGELAFIQMPGSGSGVYVTQEQLNDRGFLTNEVDPVVGQYVYKANDQVTVSAGGPTNVLIFEGAVSVPGTLNMNPGQPLINSVAGDSLTYLSGTGWRELPAETDPVYSTSTASTITTDDTNYWTTAYMWGNHATNKYLILDDTNDLNQGEFSLSIPPNGSWNAYANFKITGVPSIGAGSHRFKLGLPSGQSGDFGYGLSSDVYYGDGIGWAALPAETDPVYSQWAQGGYAGVIVTETDPVAMNSGFITGADVPNNETDPVAMNSGFITGADVPNNETDPVAMNAGFIPKGLSYSTSPSFVTLYQGPAESSYESGSSIGLEWDATTYPQSYIHGRVYNSAGAGGPYGSWMVGVDSDTLFKIKVPVYSGSYATDNSAGNADQVFFGAGVCWSNLPAETDPVAMNAGFITGADVPNNETDPVAMNAGFLTAETDPYAIKWNTNSGDESGNYFLSLVSTMGNGQEIKFDLGSGAGVPEVISMRRYSYSGHSELGAGIYGMEFVVDGDGYAKIGVGMDGSIDYGDSTDVFYGNGAGWGALPAETDPEFATWTNSATPNLVGSLTTSNLILSAVNYIDLIAPGLSLTGGGTAPQLTATGVTGPIFGMGYQDDDYAFGALQMPHSLALTNDVRTELVVYPHVHWSYATTPTGSNTNIAWKIDYQWANIGDAFSVTGNSTIVVNSTVGQQSEISAFTPITNNSAGVSSIFRFKISRVPTTPSTYPATTRVIMDQFDIHVPVDRIGSAYELHQ